MAYRTLFCGTPEFAVEPLQTLISDDRFEVCGVISQPDSRSGRGKKLHPSPIKSLGLESQIPVFTPASARAPEFIEKVGQNSYDLAVVVAYGQILSQDFLDIFPKGCFNLHGSLLPRWRGAAPIQRAVMMGDKETGVCLQKMVFKLDAGDVVGSRTIPLDSETGSRDLYKKLSTLGSELLVDELPRFLAGELTATVQAEDLVTYASKIEKAEAAIDWNQSALDIHNKVRGLDQGPLAKTRFRTKSVKILKTSVVHAGELPSGSPGEILKIHEENMDVAAGDGILNIKTLQPESKSAMSAGDFVRGFQVTEGESFANHL